jgi:hypothetical protein
MVEIKIPALQSALIACSDQCLHVQVSGGKLAGGRNHSGQLLSCAAARWRLGYEQNCPVGDI